MIDLQLSLEDIKKFDNYKLVKENATEAMGLRDRFDRA